MSNAAWFRLLVRAIGILLIGMGLPGVVSSFWWMVATLRQQDSMAMFATTDYVIMSVGNLAAMSIQLIFGVYLLFGGGAIIRYCLYDLHGRCAACGYDLTSNSSGVCPECGLAVTTKGTDHA